jgi:hypothetical protein
MHSFAVLGGSGGWVPPLMTIWLMSCHASVSSFVPRDCSVRILRPPGPVTYLTMISGHFSFVFGGQSKPHFL